MMSKTNALDQLCLNVNVVSQSQLKETIVVVIFGASAGGETYIDIYRHGSVTHWTV